MTGQRRAATAEPRGIYQAEIDVKTGRLLTPTRLLWERTGARYPEGPHLYKIRGRYYLMIAEGGTEYGHMEVIARGASPWGPWEACPRNPILTNRETQNDVAHAGHGPRGPRRGRARQLVAGVPRVPLGERLLAPPRPRDEPRAGDVGRGRLAGRERRPARPTRRRRHARARRAGVPAPPVRTGFDSPLGPEWNYLRNPRRESYSVRTPDALVLRGTATGLGEAASPRGSAAGSSTSPARRARSWTSHRPATGRRRGSAST